MQVQGASVANLPIAHRVQRNVLTSAAANALSLAMQLVVIAVTGQCLATAEYATYLVAMALVGVAEIAADFGTRVWAAQRFALLSSPGDVLSSVLKAKAFYSLVTLLFVSAYPLEGFDMLTATLCGLIAITQSSSDPALWYLRGTERLDVEALVVVVNRFSAALAACALALAGFATTSILLSWLVCNLLRIAMEITLPAVRPLLEKKSAKGLPPASASIHMTTLIAATIPLGGSLLLMSVFQRAGVLMMNAVGTPLDVAVFGTSYKFASAASFLATTVAVAHFPALVRHVDSLSTQFAHRVIKTEIAAVTLIFAPLCLAGIVIGPLAAERFAAPAWSDAGHVLAVLMPGLYISSVNIATKFTLNAFGRNWLDVACGTLGLAAFCAVFFAPFTDSPCLRAAIGWAAGEAIVFGVRLTILRRTAPEIGMQAPLVLSITALLTAAATVAWQWF